MRFLKTLGVLSLLFALSGCILDTDKPQTTRGVCLYLKEYLVVAKSSDHSDTKIASAKQITFYNKFCKVVK